MSTQALIGLGNIDGSNAFVEISGGGYARQAVTLVEDDRQLITNTNAIAFGPATGADWPSFNAMALFDPQGRLGAYWLLGMSTPRLQRVGFPAYNIAAKRIGLDPSTCGTTHGTQFFYTRSLPLLPSAARTSDVLLRDEPIVITAAAYTVQPSDSLETFILNSATPQTITLPANMPAGAGMNFMQVGLGQATFVPGAGATMTARYGGTKTMSQWARVSASVESNIGGNAAAWVLSGDMA